MRGSIALVGSGEFLPIMADFEKSLINDGIKNGNETGVDCGGSCPACGDCVNIVVEIRTDQYPESNTFHR